MKGGDPRVLFLGTNPDGSKLCAMQTPGSDVVVLSIESGDVIVSAILPAAQACGLATQLLAANLDHLGEIAERMDERVAMTIAAGLLVPTAQRVVLGQPDAPESA